MKNLKKVLAMVLAFACTFSMFAGAKVFEDVPAGSDYSEAITMLSDLGIIQGKDDGKYHPEDTITRAEACAMIARMMTGDPNVSQYVGAQNFTDVAKGSWKDSAIGYCYINGIVIGVGNNKFEPDRAITDAEFVTMVVRAMGYETADMTQGYPFSYMSNAQAIGLLDGVNMVASTDALRGEDAQVIYNALFTDYARGAKLVNTTHGTSVESYPTLAESVWGLTRAAVGTWNEDKDEDATLQYCKAHTWVVLGADPKDDGHIIAYPIDDDKNNIYTEGKGGYYSFKYDGDVSSVVGYQVELWGEGSHGEPEWQNDKNDKKYVYSEDWEIKAIKTVKGQTAYDYNASMADSKSDNGTIELADASLDLDAAADNAEAVTKAYAVDQYLVDGYHGETKLDADKVEKALNIRDGAQYKLVDWDSDGEADWVVVSPANYYKVEAVNSKRVTVVSMKIGTGDAFEEERNSDSQTWKLDDTTTIGGVDYDFKTEDTLEEGDIIEVTYGVTSDDDAQLVTGTISKVEAETKSLDKVSTKGGLTLTFDDEEIEVAQNYEEGDVIVPANPAIYRDFNSEELGTDFALYMNRNGFIVYSDYATETANYAMVLDVADGSDKAGDRKLAVVDLLLADNSIAKDVELTSGARVQDADGNDLDKVYSSREFTDEDAVVGNVYKYWTNEDGQITRMQAMFDDATLDKKDTSSTKYDQTSYSYKSSTDRLTDEDGKYVASLEEADVIFAVKGDDYIEYDQANKEFSVDPDNVMAVKYDQIPDINVDTTDADETNAKILDKTAAGWLSNKTATFVVSANGNKAGTAALLGVDNFNKFDAGNTKIGLVTDLSYTNSSDGKYVEVEVATNGEVGTIESKKKVDFDDIVEVKGFDGDVKNESTKVQNGVFYTLDANDDPTEVALDKYLEENAAYAEITTDADGNVTKVTFLDTEDGNTETNELKGDYYTVTRNVVTENKTKSFDYIDGTAYYASKDELYSVDRMPVENSGIADDAAYYTIDSKPTRLDKNYKNTLATVSAGFDGTPDIEVSDKASMLTSAIDNRYTSDTYYVADIAFNGDDEIVAMYNFTDDMGETEAKDAVLAALDATKMQAGKDTLTMTVKTVNGETSKAYTLSNVYLSGDKDKKAVNGLTANKSSGNATVSGDTVTITADRTVAAGKYAVDVLVNGDIVTTLTFEVTAAEAQTVDTAKGDGKFGEITITNNYFNVTVLDQNGDAITGLTAADFEVYVGDKKLVNPNNADEQYTVTYTRDGKYQIQVLDEIQGNDVTVTVGGKTVESTDLEVQVNADTFADALANTNVKEITLTENVSLDAQVNWNVDGGVINGNGNTITAKANKLSILGDNVTVKDVKFVSANGESALQVYQAKNVVLENVTATGSDAAIIVNGSKVTMKNCTVANTDANGWGGINVDKKGELTIEGTLDYAGVASGKPVIWLETAATGTVTGDVLTNLEKQDNKGTSKQQVWYVAK